MTVERKPKGKKKSKGAGGGGGTAGSSSERESYDSMESALGEPRDQSKRRASSPATDAERPPGGGRCCSWSSCVLAVSLVVAVASSACFFYGDVMLDSLDKYGVNTVTLREVYQGVIGGRSVVDDSASQDAVSSPSADDQLPLSGHVPSGIDESAIVEDQHAYSDAPEGGASEYLPSDFQSYDEVASDHGKEGLAADSSAEQDPADADRDDGLSGAEEAFSQPKEELASGDDDNVVLTIGTAADDRREPEAELEGQPATTADVDEEREGMLLRPVAEEISPPLAAEDALPPSDYDLPAQDESSGTAEQQSQGEQEEDEQQEEEQQLAGQQLDENWQWQKDEQQLQDEQQQQRKNWQDMQDEQQQWQPDEQQQGEYEQDELQQEEYGQDEVQQQQQQKQASLEQELEQAVQQQEEKEAELQQEQEQAELQKQPEQAELQEQPEQLEQAELQEQHQAELQHLQEQELADLQQPKQAELQEQQELQRENGETESPQLPAYYLGSSAIADDELVPLDAAYNAQGEQQSSADASAEATSAYTGEQAASADGSAYAESATSAETGDDQEYRESYEETSFYSDYSDLGQPGLPSVAEEAYEGDSILAVDEQGVAQESIASAGDSVSTEASGGPDIPLRSYIEVETLVNVESLAGAVAGDAQDQVTRADEDGEYAALEQPAASASHDDRGMPSAWDAPASADEWPASPVSEPGSSYEEEAMATHEGVEQNIEQSEGQPSSPNVYAGDDEGEPTTPAPPQGFYRHEVGQEQPDSYRSSDIDASPSPWPPAGHDVPQPGFGFESELPAPQVGDAGLDHASADYDYQHSDSDDSVSGTGDPNVFVNAAHAVDDLKFDEAESAELQLEFPSTPEGDSSQDVLDASDGEPNLPVENTVHSTGYESFGDGDASDEQEAASAEVESDPLVLAPSWGYPDDYEPTARREVQG